MNVRNPQLFNHADATIYARDPILTGERRIATLPTTDPNRPVVDLAVA